MKIERDFDQHCTYYLQLTNIIYLYTYGYINKEPAVRARKRKKYFCIASLKSVILYSASETLVYHKNVFCNCIFNILDLIYFKWNIVILLYDHFTIKVSPKKIIPIEEYGNWKISSPLFWKRKFKIRHCSNPRYKMLFWYLIRVVKLICMQRDLLYLWLEQSTAIHFSWTEKKNHSFLKKITFSIYTCIYISFTCCWVRLNLITSKTKKEGAHVGLCPYFWTEQVLKFR